MPGLRRSLDTSSTLKSVDKEEYDCAICAAGYRPTLDEMVEVTFTVSRRVRRIAAHDPHDLSFAEYFRQIFWGSGFDVPEDLEQILDEIILDTVELPPGEKALLSLQLPAEFVILMDPVTHGTQFLDVKGEPTHERQTISLVFDKVRAPTGTTILHPGPLRLSLENRTDRACCRGCGLPATASPAARPTPAFPHRKAAADQPDLSGSLRHRHDRCRAAAQDHQPDLPVHRSQGIDRALRAGWGPGRLRSGAGTFPSAQRDRRRRGGRCGQDDRRCCDGDFPTPDRAVAAALRMREAMDDLHDGHGGEDLLLKIGIHEGPCLAVVLNDRQDYFGTTVNIAARVQALADSRVILATGPVVTHPQASTLLHASGLEPVSQHRRAARHRGRGRRLRDPLPDP